VDRNQRKDTVWKTVTYFEQDDVLPFERVFTHEELERLQAGPRHGLETPCWHWHMSGNTLKIYHRYNNDGEWTQMCLFDIEINAERSVHSIVVHGYRRDGSTQLHKRRLRMMKNILGPLLDRWTGRYRLYEHRNSSGVFLCDEFGNLIHFSSAEENRCTADTMLQFDWTKSNIVRDYCEHDGLSLYRLEIPEGVRSIGSIVDIYSVNYSPALKPFTFRYTNIAGTLVIPRSLKVLNAFAFWHCIIDEVSIPGSVCALAEYAFGSCAIRTFTFEKRDILLDIEEEELPFHSSYIENLNLWRVGRETQASRIGHLRVNAALLPRGCTVECYNENHTEFLNGCKHCKALWDTGLRGLFNEAIIAKVSTFA